MTGVKCEKGVVQRVAIIGAGQTGLASIKSCLEEGMTPVCFERCSRVGGLWGPHDLNDGPSRPFMYNSLIFNTCKETTCFSDFPYPRSYPTFITQKQQYEYLKSYVEHFSLLDYIRLDTTVVEITLVSAEKGAPGHRKWRVKTTPTKAPDQEEKSEIFDAVMVCSGIASEAHMVTYPNQEAFKGKILHSCDFREGVDFKDEKVVVVGGNNSAGDVAVDCCRHTKKVFLSTRDGTWPIPRLVYGGLPFDASINTVVQTYLPNILREMFIIKLVSSSHSIRHLGLEPKYHSIFKSDIAVNDEMVFRILYGMITPKPSIERFTEKQVVFSDGTYETIDTVILGTGYETRFPFISDSIISDDPEKRSLYLHVFPTNLDFPTLAVIGMTNQLSSSLPVHEMQARFAVAVFKGDVTLPKKLFMEKQVGKTKRIMIKEYGKVKSVVSLVPYIYQLSGMMNCAPNIWRHIITGDFKLAYCLFFKPFFPYATRLRGKHSWPGARQAVLNGVENMFSATSTPIQPSKTSRVKMMVILTVVSLGIFCHYRNKDLLKPYISFVKSD